MDANLAYILVFIFAITLFFFVLNGSKSHIGKLPNQSLFFVLLSFLFPSLDLKLHDQIAEILERSKRTIHIDQYSWLTGTKILVTSDPDNVRHIMSTKFSMYPKGQKWREKIDVLGETLFSVDLEEWEQERKLVRGFTSHQKFHQVMTKIVWERTQSGLVPVLDHVCERGFVVDLQDLFQKHILDIAWMMSVGYNPNFLTIDGFEKDEFSKALEDVCEVSLSRYLKPDSLWKLQRWLGIGNERKLKHACKTIDRVFAECILKKKEESNDDQSFNFEGFYYLPEHDQAFKSVPTRKGLRDNVISLIFATQDTTSSVLSWFFWVLSKHPTVEAKIRDEIARITDNNTVQTPFPPQELNKLVYLHAALCETLRLFPPGPILSRTALQPDTLPSGHRVDPNTNVLIAVHAMGRMTSVWGEDCREFKPERWIGEGGEIKHVPSYQFVAFSAGPRVCLGKELAFTMMKATAATIIQNYSVEIVKDHPVKPLNSVVLHMKQGLMAKVRKRYWT